MKKLLSGVIAAAFIVSCTHNPPTPSKPSGTVMATLTCVGISCPVVTASSVDTSQHLAPIKWTFTVKTQAEIPANTELQIEIVTRDSAVAAR